MLHHVSTATLIFGCILVVGACDMGETSRGLETGGTTSAAGGTPALSTPLTGGTTNGTGGATNGSGGTAGGARSTGDSAATGDCTDSSTDTGTLPTQYGGAEIEVTGKQKVYYVAPNWWSKFQAQSVDYDGLSFTVSDPNSVSSGSDNAPTGYPTMFVGTYAGHGGDGSNLPKQVSALTSVPTIFSTNALDRDTSQFNAAYDVWFTAGSSPLPANQYDPGKGGAYLMVWLYKPAARQPRGSVSQRAHTVDGITSGSWDVWIDKTDPPCISYVSTTPISSLTFDLNQFIQDAVSNHYGVTSSMYLSVVFAGFEIWGNGDGLQLKQYCAQVN